MCTFHEFSTRFSALSWPSIWIISLHWSFWDHGSWSQKHPYYAISIQQSAASTFCRVDPHDFYKMAQKPTPASLEATPTTITRVWCWGSERICFRVHERKETTRISRGTSCALLLCASFRRRDRELIPPAEPPRAVLRLRTVEYNINMQ